jgi:hypothetical protein
VDALIRKLADEADIRQTIARYCWAVDHLDRAALDEVFFADATASLGRGLQRGLDEIWERIRVVLAPLTTTQHLTGSHLIDVDGDRAEHRCYFQAQHVWRDKEGGEQYLVAGTYEDRMERGPAGWRIRHRDLRIQWSSGNPSITAR